MRTKRSVANELVFAMTPRAALDVPQTTRRSAVGDLACDRSELGPRVDSPPAVHSTSARAARNLVSVILESIVEANDDHEKSAECGGERSPVCPIDIWRSASER